MTTQELYLEILRASACNDMDGQRVYDDLMAHRELWRAAYPVREAGGEEVTLRDLATDGHDVDTLYLLVTDENLPALRAVARRWKPDEYEAKARKWGAAGESVVRCWWD